MVNVKFFPLFLFLFSLSLTSNLRGEEKEWFTSYPFKNSIWMKEKALKTELVEVRELGEKLSSANIFRIFLRTGTVMPDGTIKAVDVKNVRSFYNFLINWNQDFILVPWIGFNTKKVDYHSPATRSTFIMELKGLLRLLSLSRVHLDIEPISPQEDFFSFLSSLRNELKDVKISLASPKVLLNGYEVYSGVRENFWDVMDMIKLCSMVDEMVIMFYDTGFFRVKDYVNYVKDSLLLLFPSVWRENCFISAGVPVYYEPSRKHNPAVENLNNALEGINAAVNNPQFIMQRFSGISIYDMDNLDDSELETLENFMKLFAVGERE